MMLRFGLFLLFFIFQNTLFAQGRQNTAFKGQISGIIKDAETGEPVEYATVALYNSKDSTLITGNITNDLGYFEINSNPGNYYLKAEFIAYLPVFVGDLELTRETPEMDVGTIHISPSSLMLAEVEIVEEKRQVQIGLDKKVFNVDKDLSNIGGSVTDVLENVPSVTTDMDGGISLRGSSNVRILIDGKPSGLTGISSAEALQRLPAGAIESIEVITNPSARYDAEGLAGIINIILKKEKNKGLNGQVNLSAGYPHNHNGAFNFNYKKGKFNFFLNSGIGYSERIGESLNQREIYLDSTTLYQKHQSDFIRSGWSGNMMLGTEYSLNKYNSFTVSALVKQDAGSNPRQTRYADYNENQVLTDLSIRESLELEPEIKNDYTIGYVRNFPKKGRKLTADMQYSFAEEIEDMNISEQVYNTDESPNLSIDPLLQHSITLEKQNNILIQADYQHPLGKKGKMETGYRSNIRHIDQNFNVEELGESGWVNLSNISNHFVYDEQVHGAYGIYSNYLGKYSYQIGLRAENAIIESHLKETDETMKYNYLNFFPSAHISRDLPKENKMQLSYSRRINRPSFWSLNPFTSFADPFNLWLGNPFLLPELTHSTELGNIKYWENSNMTGSVYYRYTDDVTQRIRRVNEEGVSITRPENLSWKQSMGVEVTYAKEWSKWLKMNGSLNYFRTIIDGGEWGDEFSADFYSWFTRLNTQIKLRKGTEAQIMVNYRAPSQTVQGTRRSMTFADIGIKQEVMKGKGTVSFRVADLFNSRVYLMDSYGDNFQVNTLYRRSVRVFFVGFIYNINHYKPDYKKNRGDQDYGGEEM